MTGDRAAKPAEEVPAWKRAAKERLTSLTSENQYGSQRKLALAWLGDVNKANQVSEWCNPDNPKFPETANLMKLRPLGVSIDWLLGGPSVRDDDEEWPAERVTDLSDELRAYCVRVVMDAERAWRGYATTVDRLMATHEVGSIVRGDFLQYLTRHLNRLTHRTIERVSLPGVYEAARRWRKAQARTKRRK